MERQNDYRLNKDVCRRAFRIHFFQSFDRYRRQRAANSIGKRTGNTRRDFRHFVFAFIGIVPLPPARNQKGVAAASIGIGGVVAHAILFRQADYCFQQDEYRFHIIVL